MNPSSLSQRSELQPIRPSGKTRIDQWERERPTIGSTGAKDKTSLDYPLSVLPWLASAASYGLDAVVAVTRFRHPKAEVGCKSIVHLYPRGKACSIVNSLRAQWVLELPLTSKRIRRQWSVCLLQGVNKHRLQNICKCIERTFPLAKGSAWWEFSSELIPGHVQELQVGMCFSESIPRSSDKVGRSSYLPSGFQKQSPIPITCIIITLTEVTQSC